MRWWKRRRRNHYPKWRTLKEGDIVWLEKGTQKDPLLLVQRIHRKVERAHTGMVYWYDGVFLSLTTGEMTTRKLSNGMTFAEVTRAPRPPEPEEDEEDDDDE